MFQLIEPSSRRAFRRELADMHRLRHRVFVEKLQWPLGDIRSVDGMEFDQFDNDHAHYIIHTNDCGHVDGCVRLLPTDGPYLLADVFPHLIESQPAPRSPSTWEISRFCADPDTAPPNVVAQFCTAIVEFAIDKGIDTIVSVSDLRMEPLLRRAGWCPQRLGAPAPTATDVAVGFIYPANLTALSTLRCKSRLTERLLPPPPGTQLYPLLTPLSDPIHDRL